MPRGRACALRAALEWLGERGNRLWGELFAGVLDNHHSAGLV